MTAPERDEVDRLEAVSFYVAIASWFVAGFTVGVLAMLLVTRAAS